MSSSSTRPGTSTSRRMLSSSPSRGAPGPRSCSRPASPSSICPSPGGADATSASGFPELCRPHSDARDLMAILRAKIEAKENMMAKYLLLKHYRSAPASVNDVPMDQWTPEELSAHVQYMQDFAARLEGTGEFVDSQALSPEGTFVRYDGEGRPPVTDGPFAETKDLIAGWMVIDVETYERALELAGELSAAPGAGGKPIHEWLEVRPFLAEPLTITE